MQDVPISRTYAAALDIVGGFSEALLRHTLLSGAERSYIAMFHDVVPDGAALDDPYACRVSALERYLAVSRELGYTFLSLPELLARRDPGTLKKHIVLTFDDGFASTLHVAAPVLERYGAPYTVYVCSGYVGKPGYLSAADVQALAERPLCTLGSHTHTHAKTRFLSEAAVESELLTGKCALEELTGRRIEHFAFPSGTYYACSRRDRRIARACGFSSVALTKQVALTRRDLAKPFALPRYNMTGVLKRAPYQSDRS